MHLLGDSQDSGEIVELAHELIDWACAADPTRDDCMGENEHWAQAAIVKAKYRMCV